MAISDSLRRFVKERAGDACEYCKLPQWASLLSHHIDHIIAQQHDGGDTAENLCLSCLRCNLNKGTNLASVDPASEQLSVVSLFHPRRHHWKRHFQYEENGRIEGKTPRGRATAKLLGFNAKERVHLRLQLQAKGWKPV